MIRELRKKFILIAMLSTFIVLSAIMGTVNISGYLKMATRADDMTSVLGINDGKFPGNGKEEMEHTFYRRLLSAVCAIALAFTAVCPAVAAAPEETTGTPQTLTASEVKEMQQTDAAVTARIAEVLEIRAAEPQQRRMLETYLAEIPFPADARVLEVGCGTGAVARRAGD